MIDPTECPQDGAPLWRNALLRAVPEDFRVDELLGFAPDGEGEHLFVQVEKRGANTLWVAAQLARWAGVAESAVGYAGLKDRHAVTTQWFSLHLPGRADPGEMPDNAEFRVLQTARHRRKLQRGALHGNRFEIVLRDIEGLNPDWEARAHARALRGVPNYFGTQRFGRDGGNLAAAKRMFAGARVGRAKRGILLSAARSAVFNQVLASRVRAGAWDVPVEGEVFMLDGSHSVFGPQDLDAELRARCSAGDIHPTGPLWGAGALRSSGAALEFDRGVEASDPALLRSLETAGLRQERRSLRLSVQAWSVDRLDAQILRVGFDLPAGSYATAVLEALGPCSEPSRHDPEAEPT